MIFDREPAKELYWRKILAAGAMDPDGIHHEFAKGQHGQKIDMDAVLGNRCSSTYLLALALKSRMIADRAVGHRIGILSIANGALQYGRDMSRYMSFRYPNLNVVAMDTEKRVTEAGKTITLTSMTRQILKSTGFDSIVLNDDIGTSGSSAAQPVPELHRYGVRDIFAAYDVLRANSLPLLNELNVPVHTILRKPMQNLDPADCRSWGMCAEGWQLVGHGQS